MITEHLELDFSSVGGTVASEFELMLERPGPYTGGTPWLITLDVYEFYDGKNFIAELKRRGKSGLVARALNPSYSPKEELICEYITTLCTMPHCSSMFQLEDSLAALGYRTLKSPTGHRTGLTLELSFIADAISELDAALQLDSDVDAILDLLDAGQDPMREHVRFGTPYRVALKKSAERSDYSEVVAYMRALGAYC